MWLIVQVQSMMKMILNFHDQLDQLPTMMKTRYDNYVIDRTNAVYVEYKIELPWLSGSGSICDENQIGQWCD